MEGIVEEVLVEVDDIVVVAHHQVDDTAEGADQVRVVTEVVHRLVDTKVVSVARVVIVHHAVRADTKAVALAEDTVAMVEDTVMEVMAHLVHHAVSSLIVHAHQEVNKF